MYDTVYCIFKLNVNFINGNRDQYVFAIRKANKITLFSSCLGLLNIFRI